MSPNTKGKEQAPIIREKPTMPRGMGEGGGRKWLIEPSTKEN